MHYSSGLAIFNGGTGLHNDLPGLNTPTLQHAFMENKQAKNPRRKFIKQVALMAAAPVLVPENGAQQPLIHQVFFWLKHPENPANQRQLIAGLKKLKAIPQIQKLLIGVPASTEKRDVVDNSFQVSETMYFKNTRDQEAYQVHPLHKAFVAENSHLWERVVVYDMMVI